MEASRSVTLSIPPLNRLYAIVFCIHSLERASGLQSTYSGSTACVILMRDGTLHVMNLGDSRAVLGRKEKRVVLDDVDDTKVHNLYTAVDLTWDQCPDLPSERERIERRGGYVSQGTVAYQDASDYTVDTSNDSSSPSRVWLDSDYQQIGLAMSRSIGDLALQKVGVSSHPVVSTYQLVDGDDFIIIASDGVWQFISSSQAVDIVGTCFDNGQNAMETCKILIEKSVEQWRSREGDYRDDITAIVIRLKDLWRCQGGGRRRCSKE